MEKSSGTVILVEGLPFDEWAENFLNNDRRYPDFSTKQFTPYFRVLKRYFSTQRYLEWEYKRPVLKYQFGKQWQRIGRVVDTPFLTALQRAWALSVKKYKAVVAEQGKVVADLKFELEDAEEVLAGFSKFLDECTVTITETEGNSVEQWIQGCSKDVEIQQS